VVGGVGNARRPGRFHFDIESAGGPDHLRNLKGPELEQVEHRLRVDVSKGRRVPVLREGRHSHRAFFFPLQGGRVDKDGRQDPRYPKLVAIQAFKL